MRFFKNLASSLGDNLILLWICCPLWIPVAVIEAAYVTRQNLDV